MAAATTPFEFTVADIEEILATINEQRVAAGLDPIEGRMTGSKGIGMPSQIAREIDGIDHEMAMPTEAEFNAARVLAKRNDELGEAAHQVCRWYRGQMYIRSAAERALLAIRDEDRPRMTCNSCCMLSINGVACHETGCPNSGARWDGQEGVWVQVRECFECGCTVDRDDPCCSGEERWTVDEDAVEDGAEDVA